MSFWSILRMQRALYEQVLCAIIFPVTAHLLGMKDQLLLWLAPWAGKVNLYLRFDIG